MSTFPALAPNARLYVPGDLPSVRQTSLSGVSSGFRRGNRRIGQSLSMSFSYLTEAQMLLVKDHYINRQGTFDIFYLSAEIWGDLVRPPVPLISDFVWRYASEITIADTSFDRFTVEVELETVPIDIGDLIFDAEQAAVSPARTYILDAGGAAAAPARDYIINTIGAA